MRTNLLEEIKELVRNQLPGVKVEELREYLNTAEKNMVEVDKLKKENKVLKESNDSLSKDLKKVKTELESLKTLVGDIEKREKDLSLKEIKHSFDVELVNKEREFATSKVQLMKELVYAVFRNPRFVHTESGEIPVRITDEVQDGTGYINKYQRTEIHNTSKTITDEMI